jgi:hypothetical protein
MSEIRALEVKSWAVDVFVAGDEAEARRICAYFCFEVGLCVSVTPCEFVYTGGSESGVRVGLINYPRFPAQPAEIEGKARELAERLIVGLSQHSASVQTPERTVWLTRRPE